MTANWIWSFRIGLPVLGFRLSQVTVPVAETGRRIRLPNRI
jgi:hypothetical protein